MSKKELQESSEGTKPEVIYLMQKESLVAYFYRYFEDNFNTQLTGIDLTELILFANLTISTIQDEISINQSEYQLVMSPCKIYATDEYIVDKEIEFWVNNGHINDIKPGTIPLIASEFLLLYSQEISNNIEYVLDSAADLLHQNLETFEYSFEDIRDVLLDVNTYITERDVIDIYNEEEL